MDEQFQLKLRKGVYPYEYMDDWEKFEENCLPQLKHFTADSVCRELVSATTTTPRAFGKCLGRSIWETIMISISKVICCCYARFLKPSG